MWKFLSGLAWMMTAFIVHAATMITVTQPYYYLNGDWHSESNKNPTVSPYGLILFSSTTPVRLSAVPPRGYALDQWMLWDGFGYAGYSRLADIPSSRIIATSTDYLFTVSWDSYYSPNWNNNLYATPCFSWLKYDLVYEPNYGGLSRAYGERGLIYTNTVEVAGGDVAGRIPGWESSRRGYEVAGWSTDPEATRASFDTGETVLKAGDKFNATTNGLVTLYAVWQKKPMPIELDPQGGTVTPGSITAYIDETYDLPTPTRDDYDFNGWYDAAEGGNLFTNGMAVTRTDVTKLYAQWLKNRHTVTLYPGEGVSVTPTSVRVAVGDTWVLPTPVRTGYAFDGWFTAAEGGEEIVNGSTVESLSTTELFAQWTANVYSVSFLANGAEGTMPNEPYAYDEAEALTPNVFAWSGHTFRGWGLSATDAEPTYDDGQIVSNLTAVADATVTLHALWSPNSYTIRFDRNGGQGSMSAQTMVYDTPATLSENAFTRGAEGTFTFLGWATAADGAVEFKDGALVTNLVSEGSITLYAVWEHNLSDLAKAADSDFELGATGPSASLVVVDSTMSSYGGSSIRFSEGVVHCAVTGIVHGAGTLTFKWRSNHEMAHSDGKQSGLMFAVQEEGKPFASPDIAEVPGVDEWTEVSYRIDATGQTILLWRAYWFALDYGGDCVAWLDQITWTPDGDGPTEEDAPVIDGMTKDGDGISISISTSDTRFDYQLLGTRDLSTKGDWPVIRTVSGTGEPIAFPDLINKDEPKMFYKVRVIQRQ